MANSTSVSVVQQEVLRRSWRRLLVAIILLLIFLIGLVTIVAGGRSRHLRQDQNGAEQSLTYAERRRPFQAWLHRRRAESGLPYWVWQALPRLFPEAFVGP